MHAAGDEGLARIGEINPHGLALIETLARSEARLEPTEDLELLYQVSDWQRCMNAGLFSQHVRETAMAGYQEAASKRYEHVSSRIDDALKPAELGIMFMGQDHRVQYPQDVQVFYVSPPALNDINRWLEDQMRRMAQQAAQQAQDPN